MALIATFDLGTTALKCVVLDDHQNQLFSGKRNLTTYESDGMIEQDPEEWWKKFCELTHSFDASQVTDLIFSGQMQDLVFIGKDGHSLRRAILYNDQRATAYVEKIPQVMVEKSSVSMNGSIPLPKMLWMKDNEPDILKKTSHILISAKDYLVSRLTGKYVSDVTTMATTGMMDIRTFCYIDMDDMVSPSVLPEICRTRHIVGKVSRQAMNETGLPLSADVFAGSGDAGATTLASGIIDVGELSINLGTSGWIAAISEQVLPDVFNLPAINEGKYINVIGILNAASVHKWLAWMLYPNDAKRYDLLHELLVSDEKTNGDLLCLPYLVGERFPVADSEIRGAYIGLDGNTSLADLARSALEGVAFSLKQGLEKLKMIPQKVTLVGGGANEPVWCQIFSNIFQASVVVYHDSESLPSMALSSVVMVEKGLTDSYKSFIQAILEKQERTVYSPQGQCMEHYKCLYEDFKKIYPAIAPLHH
jgi:xylulokinase